MWKVLQNVLCNLVLLEEGRGDDALFADVAFN